jgi:hypothetical protein
MSMALFLEGDASKYLIYDYQLMVILSMILGLFPQGFTAAGSGTKVLV